jgi:hypothetical protein
MRWDLVKIRFKVAWQILTRPGLSWFWVPIEREDLYAQLMGESYGAETWMHRLQMTNVKDVMWQATQDWDHDEAWERFKKMAKEKYGTYTKEDVERELAEAVLSEKYEDAARLKRLLDSWDEGAGS